MKIKYVGPHQEGVWINRPNGGSLGFPHGEAVEIDSETGKSLILQVNNWELVSDDANHKTALKKADKGDN